MNPTLKKSVKKKKSRSVYDDILPIPRMAKRTACVLVTILSAGCYIIALDGDFVFDDSEAVVNNEDVKLDSPIANVFFNDFWGTRMSHNASHKSYRPITVLSFKFNVWFSGGQLVSYQFKIVNIMLHSLVCVLSIQVFEMMMNGNCSKASNLCAVLFCVHPIHTEAVAGVVGRAELMCALFSFLSLILYDKAVNAKSQVKNVVFTLLSIIIVSMAMFSKEQGITMLGICLFYDMWIANRTVLQKIYVIVYNRVTSNINKINTYSYNSSNGTYKTCRNNDKKHTPGNSNIWFLLVRIMLIFASSVLLVYVRWLIMDGMPPEFKPFDNPAAFVDSTLFRIINYNYVYAINAWLLICPWWLCYDWSMGCIPTIDSIYDIRIVFVIAFWITVISLVSCCLIYANSNSYHRNIIMAIAFLSISFLPASNLFFKVGFVIAERVLYLPSIGYCIVVVLSIQRVLEYIAKSTYKYQSACVWVVYVSFWFLIISVFSVRSVQRSNEWRTEKNLFNSALAVCPLNAKVHYNLGKIAANKTESLQYYKQAIRLNPDYDQAMNNLANLLKDDGKLDEAEELLRKSVKLRPNFAAAWMNLGIVLSNKMHHTEAEFCFMEALRFRKHYPDCYYNLGNLYLDQKRYKEAGLSWRKATSQKPTHSVAWNNLIIMLDSIGRYEESEATALEALYTLPLEPGIHFNLANTLGKLSRFVEAEKHFKIAIEINSNQPLYYVNLGVLYHRWKKFDNAKEMYQKALQLNPKLESAERNLKMLK